MNLTSNQKWVLGGVIIVSILVWYSYYTPKTSYSVISDNAGLVVDMDVRDDYGGGDDGWILLSNSMTILRFNYGYGSLNNTRVFKGDSGASGIPAGMSYTIGLRDLNIGGYYGLSTARITKMEVRAMDDCRGFYCGADKVQRFDPPALGAVIDRIRWTSSDCGSYNNGAESMYAVVDCYNELGEKIVSDDTSRDLEVECAYIDMKVGVGCSGGCEGDDLCIAGQYDIYWRNATPAGSWGPSKPYWYLKQEWFNGIEITVNQQLVTDSVGDNSDGLFYGPTCVENGWDSCNLAISSQKAQPICCGNWMTQTLIVNNKMEVPISFSGVEFIFNPFSEGDDNCRYSEAGVDGDYGQEVCVNVENTFPDNHICWEDANCVSEYCNQEYDPPKCCGHKAYKSCFTEPSGCEDVCIGWTMLPQEEWECVKMAFEKCQSPLGYSIDNLGGYVCANYDCETDPVCTSWLYSNDKFCMEYETKECGTWEYRCDGTRTVSYWMTSCGDKDEFIERCGQGCDASGSCYHPTTTTSSTIPVSTSTTLPTTSSTLPTSTLPTSTTTTTIDYTTTTTLPIIPQTPLDKYGVYVFIGSLVILGAAVYKGRGG